MKKWEKFSQEELELFVKESYSYAQLAEKCGYCKTSGSAIQYTKEMIQERNLDISHFTGQAHNKNEFDYSRFKYGNNIKAAQAIDAISYLRGWHCECCGLSEWLNQPITLEVHHKDGDRLNNVLENLELLCPNCHSYTENWRGKNIDKKITQTVSEEDFVSALQKSPNIRQALLSLGLAAKGGNYSRAHELIVKYQIIHLLEPRSRN